MHAGRDGRKGTSWRRPGVSAQGHLSRTWILFLVAILGGSSLFGCTEAPPNQQLASDLAPTVSAVPDMPQMAAPPPPAPKAAPKRRPRTAKNTERKVAVPDPVTKVTAIDPVALVGMAPPAFGNLLGRPIGTRQSALTIEWTYATRSCSLVIVFYPDITTGALHALKFNVTDAGGREDGASCIHHILSARSDNDD